eukprot:SAG11_NODE_6000_length_1412_cov_4.797411_1_plen_234_part_00
MDTTDLEVAEDIVDLCEALEPTHGYAQVYMCNLQTQISEAHKQITTEFKGRVATAVGAICDQAGRLHIKQAALLREKRPPTGHEKRYREALGRVRDRASAEHEEQSAKLTDQLKTLEAQLRDILIANGGGNPTRIGSSEGHTRERATTTHKNPTVQVYEERRRSSPSNQANDFQDIFRGRKDTIVIRGFAYWRGTTVLCIPNTTGSGNPKEYDSNDLVKKKKKKKKAQRHAIH